MDTNTPKKHSTLEDAPDAKPLTDVVVETLSAFIQQVRENTDPEITKQYREDAKNAFRILIALLNGGSVADAQTTISHLESTAVDEYYNSADNLGLGISVVNGK